jgi:hypothetical protein
MSRLPHPLLDDRICYAEEFDLSVRRRRARVYEIVLREGTAQDILEYVDGTLLADLWPDLVLPSAIRLEWQPLIDSVRASPAA